MQMVVKKAFGMFALETEAIRVRIIWTLCMVLAAILLTGCGRDGESSEEIHFGMLPGSEAAVI